MYAKTEQQISSHFIAVSVSLVWFCETNNIWDVIMNHDSGFIIGIAMFFAKILIEHTLKTCLKKHPQTKNNPLVVLCK